MRTQNKGQKVMQDTCHRCDDKEVKELKMNSTKAFQPFLVKGQYSLHKGKIKTLRRKNMKEKKEVRRVRKDWNLQNDIQKIHVIMKREAPETESEVMDVFAHVQKSNALLILGNAQAVSEIVSKYLGEAKESESLRKEEREKAYTAILARLDGKDLLNGKVKEGRDAIGDDTEKLAKFDSKMRTVAVILTKLLDGKPIVNDTKDDENPDEVNETGDNTDKGIEETATEGKVEIVGG
jgi:hypothetical protein